MNKKQKNAKPFLIKKEAFFILNSFMRAFAISLAAVILLFLTFFSFEVINMTVEKSGFSSGAVFEFLAEGDLFKIEFLGRKFFFDISPFSKILSIAEGFLILLPPVLRLFIAGIILLF